MPMMYKCNDVAFSELTDVDVASVTNGQVPKYNSTTHEWEAGDATPFELGIESGAYGYYNAQGTFIPFKTQADIDSAVAAAKVGTATQGDVLSGKTFTNTSTSGLTGSMVNNGAVSPSGLNCGGSYTIPAGYHNGSGKVTANSLASQTTPASGKTAVGAGQMLTGYSGWVNGSRVNGTMANNGSCGATLTRASNSKTVAAGYTSGGTISVANGVAKIGSTDKTWGNGGTVNLGFNDSLSVGAGVYYAGTIKAPNPSGTLNLPKPTDGQEANVIDCKSYASVNAFYPWQRGVERGAAAIFAAATGGSDCFATYQFSFWLWTGCSATVKLDERNVALINGDVLVAHFDDGTATTYSLEGKNAGYSVTILVPGGKQLGYLELYLKGTGVYKYCRMFVTSVAYV